MELADDSRRIVDVDLKVSIEGCCEPVVTEVEHPSAIHAENAVDQRHISSR